MPSPNTTLLASVIVAAVTGATSGWFASQHGQESVDHRLRPPIAVLNYADALNGAPDEVEQLMVNLDAKAEKLAAAGFLVINANAVVAYPPVMRVPTGGEGHE